MTAAVDSRIATAHLADLFPGIADNRLLCVSSTLFSFGVEEMPVLHPHEQLVLAAITQQLAPQTIVELGTAQGQTTLLLAANSPEHAQVITVDLAPPLRGPYSAACLRGDDQVGSVYRASPLARKVRQILLAQPKGFPPELRALEGRVDLFLIDGDHSYDGVRRDTELALALAAPEAVFAWHDYYAFPDYVAQGPARRGVYPYLNELAAVGPLSLFQVAGSYLVLGRRRWPTPVRPWCRRPDARPGIFQERIVRLADT